MIKLNLLRLVMSVASLIAKISIWHLSTNFLFGSTCPSGFLIFLCLCPSTFWSLHEEKLLLCQYHWFTSNQNTSVSEFGVWEILSVQKEHVDFLQCCSFSASCQPFKDVYSSLIRKDTEGLLVAFTVIWKDGKVS